MTDNHDVFWRLLFGRINCSIEFFRFLLKEKSEILELENLVLFQEIFYRKKKLLYEFLYETPFRNSKEKMYFLLELKYRRAGDFEIQILKYKIAIHKWQNIEFGKLYYIILILFYQGLDNWDPECEFEEVINLKNSISSGAKEEIIIFD
jgi:hypothetical protein